MPFDTGDATPLLSATLRVSLRRTVVKPCPFCAEEIQDAAVVCKHCGRDLNAPARSVNMAPGTGAPKKSRTLTWALGGALAVVAGLYLAGQASSTYAASPTGHPVVEPAAPPPPIIVSIAEGNATEIKAGHYHDYTFELPARVCSIAGRVEGISGGGKDFEGFIMDDDNFRNWSAGHQAKGFESGRVVVWSPNEMVRGPGKYHFVVSNTFSTLTDKAVTVQAKAECP